MILTTIIVFTIGAIVLIYVDFDRGPETPDKKEAEAPKEANLVIGNVRQVSKKDGRDEWLLEAGSVKYLTAENKAVFEDLSVVFYGKDNKRTYLDAKEGVLKTDSRNIGVHENVRIRRRGYHMKTESIDYLHRDELLMTNHPVFLTGPQIELSADAMKMDLRTDKIIFTGGVKGTLNGNIEIKSRLGF